MKDVTIIIPVYNEQDTVLKIVKKVSQVDVDKEIIIVDDASTDKTSELLKEVEAKHEIRLITHTKNMGRGAAILTGLDHAQGKIVIFQDADLELDPANYPRLIEPILESETEVVFGSRFLGKGFIQGMGITYYIGNVVLAELTDILFRKAKLTDVLTMFQVTRTEILRNLDLRSTRWEFPIEIMAKLLRRGYNILEIPVDYVPRSRKAGKKISWKAFFPCLFTLIRYRFSKKY